MPRQLPTGVVTFLFTDVEGSTRLLHELGGVYAEALYEHRRLLREAFDAHGGVEVDTQGDAFFVSFGRASDAVAAAVDAQRALAGGPIKVRMGLHTGEPRLTDEGYVGLDVHRGARIAAVGHGGQVLLSRTTSALVDAAMRDLGPHRLKDLTVPERIYQLEIDGLPSEFPLLKTVEAGMKNFPAPRTSFVGRVEELERIEQMLEDPDCRLLTLVGPGGVGKTRLALEAAAHRVDHYPHGVHFVPLVGVASPDLLVPAVAESLQFQVDTAHSAVPAREQLVDYLRERSALLVLDNFEHLLGARDLLAEIVERAAQVEMLTTSRERLEVQSEWVFDVEGLDLGNGHAGGSAAVRLFVERARQVESGFALAEDEQPHVERVCRLVDGMPLGIELAAAWISTLPCEEIADEIERNLGFLEASMQDLPERHRSLRAAFDQSWRLLPDDARRVFARLSVFRGGFTREAAAAVAEAGLADLRNLVAKSLVHRADLGRFELHELLRQYAAERLAQMPDELEAVSERHARHYTALLAGQRDALLGPRMAEARDELRHDLGNLRRAAEWAATHWSGDEARGVLRVLRVFFFVHGEFEGATTFERLADAVGVTPTTRADPSGASDAVLAVLVHEAGLRIDLGYDVKAERLARACVAVLRERGQREELGWALGALGIAATYRDVYPEAARYLEEAVEVAGVACDEISHLTAVTWLGYVRLVLDDLEGARRWFGEAFEISSELGQPLASAYALSKLGLLADTESDFARAIALHLEASETFAGIGYQGGAGFTLSRASMSAYCLGDYERAMQYAQAGYEGFEQASHRWGMTAARCRLGFAAAALGYMDEARGHLRAALELAREMQASSLLLHALSAVGVLLAREGEERRAAEVLLFALGHEAMPATYRLVVQPTLDELESRLSPDELDEAREAAVRADLDTLVAEALGERVR